MAATDTLFGAMTILFIFLICYSATAASINGGFTVKLIHRDSPNSPFCNPNKTPSNKPLFPNIPQSEVRADNGEFLMELSIGNPPFHIYGIADTGSDLMWTQCPPCDACYPQINQIFDPKNSSTYIDLPCDAEECQDTFGNMSCSPQKVCNYLYKYGDGSFTKGVLARETITLSSTSGEAISLKNIVFGCGHNNTGVFHENEMGIVGLGGGPLSLISQMGSLFGGRKFSYCLMPFNTDPSIESKISFGSGSEVLGEDVVSTPLVSRADKTYYFVTVEGIRVGDKLVPFSSSGVLLKGNMIMDSGTPVTRLPQDFYDRLASEVQKQIPMTPIENDPNLGTMLCYQSKTNLRGPILTVHFEGDANVQLTPAQTFIQLKDEVFCFAMLNVAADGIYGNFAQSNFLIGYDLERMMVSFKPTDCTKQ